MRKIRKSLHRTIKSVTIYREDLEAIEQIAKDLSSDGFIIRFGEHEYESFKEIPKNTPDTHELQLEFRNPYISIEFSGIETRIYAANENLKAMGGFESIVKVIEHRSHKYRQAIVYVGTIIGGPAVVVSLVSLYYFLNEKTTFYAIVSGIFAIIFGYWIYYSYQHDIRKNSTIIYSKSSSRSNFFKRKKMILLSG